MDALLRRPAPLVFMLAMALLGPSATALADGRDVLADVEDNSRVDRCYSRAELDDALDLLPPNDRLYGVKGDLIRDARINRVARPGVGCGSGRAGAVAVADTSGGSPGVFLGVAVAVGAVAVGAGVWTRRAGGGG